MKDEDALKIEENIGRNVQSARNALGWTQADLSHRTDGRVSRSIIAKIESFNATTISIETLSELGKALSISPYVLMLGELEWKKLARIALSQTFITRYFASEKNKISAEEAVRLEDMAKSPKNQQRREAIHETNLIVDCILNLEDTPPSHLAASAEISRTAATAIAVSMIPNQPIFNGVIASIISG